MRFCLFALAVGIGTASAQGQIDRKTVHNLQKAWEWRTGEKPMEAYGTRPGLPLKS